MTFLPVVRRCFIQSSVWLRLRVRVRPGAQAASAASPLLRHPAILVPHWHASGNLNAKTESRTTDISSIEPRISCCHAGGDSESESGTSDERSPGVPLPQGREGSHRGSYSTRHLRRSDGPGPGRTGSSSDLPLPLPLPLTLPLPAASRLRWEQSLSLPVRRGLILTGRRSARIPENGSTGGRSESLQALPGSPVLRVRSTDEMKPRQCGSWLHDVQHMCSESHRVLVRHCKQSIHGCNTCLN